MFYANIDCLNGQLFFYIFYILYSSCLQNLKFRPLTCEKFKMPIKCETAFSKSENAVLKSETAFLKSETAFLKSKTVFF